MHKQQNPPTDPGALLEHRISIPAGLHQDTVKTVLDATNALMAKLYDAQVKYNLKDGWRTLPEGATEDGKRYFDSPEGCVKALRAHLAKGDVIDAMAYLSYLHTLCGPSKVKEISAVFKTI